MVKAGPEDMLQIEGLAKAFGGLVAVKDVSFYLKDGEILGLIGPNGAGKTTVYNLITGLLPLDKGRILLKGDDISGLPAHVIVRKGIARTFQGVRIFDNLTLEENLEIARHLRSKKSSSHKRGGEDEVVTSTAEFLGLSASKNELARSLRLIDQTLLGIGMALCTELKVLLLDEPSAGLNPSEVNMIMSIVEQIRKREIPVLLIEHNMKAVMGICDRIIVLDHGEKIAEGTPLEISNNKRVIEAYLGTRHAA